MKRQVFALLIPALAILVAVFPNAREFVVRVGSSIMLELVGVAIVGLWFYFLWKCFCWVIKKAAH